jgi:predicted nucleic acid-binding protein
VILVDTSVLIGYLRGHQSSTLDLFDQIERELVSFALPVVCFQEVLQGARDEKEWRLLEDYLGGLEMVSEADPQASHREAARIYFDCRRKGITLRSTIDCLIAQIALEQGATLLHDDSDFELIRKVRPLQTLHG